MVESPARGRGSGDGHLGSLIIDVGACTGACGSLATNVYTEGVLSRTIDEVGGDALIGVHGDGY